MILKCIVVAILIGVVSASEEREQTTEVKQELDEDNLEDNYKVHTARNNLEFAIDDLLEGRKKKKKLKKKYAKYAAIGLIKAAVLTKFLAFVKMLTVKAYVVSVIGLVLAALLNTGGSDHHDSVKVIHLLPKGRSFHGTDLNAM